MDEVRKNDLTLSDEEISYCVGLLGNIEDDLKFQSRLNRDAVVMRAKQAGLSAMRSSLADQAFEPRHTTEGRLAGLRLGMANDLTLATLYRVEIFRPR